MGYRLGCVPYINAVPLVAMFEESPEYGVEVVYAVPSKLPDLLDAGEVDAILVSSYCLLTVPSLRAAPVACIGSRGPVASVRLFSKVPLGKIASLALDVSSMTSNALCRLVLKERYGREPRTSVLPPDLKAMLSDHDAGILIGDIGMTEEGKGLYKLDLGEAWTDWQGLPFVWALWVGRDRLDPWLAGLLQTAARASWLGQEAEKDLADLRTGESAIQEASERVDSEAARAFRSQATQLAPSDCSTQEVAEHARSKIVRLATNLSGIDKDTVRDYLVRNMRYRIGPDEVRGLTRFGELLRDAGHPVRSDAIEWVRAPDPSPAATV